MRNQPYSLKKKLIIYTSLFSVLMGCLLVFSAYRIALEETEEILNAQMRNLAERVAKFNPRPVQSQFDHLKHYHEEDLFVDVWPYQNNNHLNHQFQLLVKPVESSGFYVQPTSHGEWQTYVLPLNDLQIQVSQQKSVRQNLALELAWNMFMPYLIIMPFAIWGLSYIIRRSFKPIENFKSELIERKPNELTPISCDCYPIEIVPSIQEVNHLFQRISDAQLEQKQFVADAAHELRTPITALNLQTQILLRELPHNASLMKLSHGLARIQHLVSQLLSLAKQDAFVLNQEHERYFLINEVAVQCVEQLIHLAIEKEIDLGMERQEDVKILSQESAVHSIIYNLIDNAIKYTPNQGIINVSAFLEQDQATIHIEDSGPGIPPEQYDQILKRFYRVHQHLETGSGLGLSIVDKATERLGGKIIFQQSKQLGGLHVIVQIPLKNQSIQSSVS